MPMAGSLKKHHEAVTPAPHGASDGSSSSSNSCLPPSNANEELFCTPVRRPHSNSSTSGVKSEGKNSAVLALDFDAHVQTIDTSDAKKRRSSIGSISGSAASSALSSAVSSAMTEPNKRKRKSIGTSTVKALAGCFLSTNKKRARMSIGTPGKAIPLDVVREQDVAKRFIELEVTEVYKAIRKQTGALGGNAAGGAIYGEITQASFQRIVDYMKEHCELSESSLFLDVGSGLGKPNFHVAIDPGVEVSYGIELEELRWHLSLHNLKSVLKLEGQNSKANRTMFSAGDITDAKTLNPFSHIYSFDVGFPPNVMDELAATFNRSTAKYFVSFHAPRKVVEMYGFAVENLGRVATSMAGSSEGHMCYFYRRLPGAVNDPLVTPSSKATAKSSRKASRSSSNSAQSTDATDDDERLLHIDPLFREGFDVLNRGRDGTLAWIESFFGEKVYSGRTRGQKAKSAQVQKRQERPLESYYRVVGKARVAEADAAASSSKGTKKLRV